MSLFRPNTVEGAIANFDKTVADLERIAENAKEDAKRLSFDISALRVRQEQRQNEAARANDIATNIRNLIGSPKKT